MKLVLKHEDGGTASILIQPEETFKDLKKRVQDETGLTLDLQDLTVGGKVMGENQRVIDFLRNSEAPKAEEEPLQDVRCSVPICENTKFTCPDKAFFMFPLEEMRRHQWALYCHRLSDVSGKHKLALNAHSVICADHFRKDQFVKNTTTLLKRTAVPCICPEIPSMSSETSNRRRSAFRSGIVPPVNTELALASLESTGAMFLLPEASITEANGTDEDISAFCRLCSNSCSNFVFIFDEVGKKLKVADKINSFLPISVKETDPLPKQVCRSCMDKVTLVCEVADMCLKAETKLRSMVENSKFSSEPLTSEDMLSADEEDSQDCGVVQRPTNMAISKSWFCCPLCSCGKMVTKSGIYRVEYDSCSQPETIKNEDLEVNSQNQDLDEMKPVLDSAGVKDDCSNREAQLESTKNEKESIKASRESEHLWNGQDYCSKIPDLDVDTLYNDPNSIVRMELDSIPEEGDWDGLGSKRETKIVIKGEKHLLVCRLCGIEFSEPSALLDHSEDHSDIDCFPCTVCDQWFNSKTVLDTHFFEKHFKNSIPENVHHCEACGLSFKSALRLETHMCGSGGAGSNRCRHCQKFFRSECRLEFHQRFHKGARPGYCEICQKTFPDEQKLYKHTMYLHAEGKGHCCEECGKVFRSSSSLRYHQRSHQGEDMMQPFPCEYCGKCFVRKSMLRTHFLNTHKDKSQEGNCFTCKLCYEAFPNTDEAVNHMDVMHIPECSGETTYSFEMHTVKKLFMCEYCERCFTDTMNLNAHRELHPPSFPYQCKLCNEAFSSPILLGEHKKLHYANGVRDFVSDFTVPNVYMCEYCGRCFMSCVKLSEHLTVHFGEEPYHCLSCDKRFKTQAEFSEHRLTHDQTDSVVDDSYRPYECHYCSKSFAIEDALVKHIRMHTGEKPYICDQCGKGFSQSSGLYTHQKVHSDERPYSCGVCPRTFKIKGDRDVHLRKHSGDRPYKCDFCGKAFMTQHVYSQHRKIHTGERPYKCDVCGIAFRRSHVLTVHKRIHTGEKPNVCDICGKRYRQKGDMLKHRRLQHGIVKVRIQKFEY